MANVNAAMGLRAVRLLGLPGEPVASEHTIADGYNTAIYSGDLVKSTGTGPNIAVCAAGDRSCGVFAGCQYTTLTGDIFWRPYWTASLALATGTLAKAFVYDFPFTIFEVQVSGTAGLVATDIGNFADIVDAAGSTTSGTSGVMLDQASLTATTASGGQQKILRLSPTVGNDYGQYAKALVMINEHEYMGGTTAGASFNAT